MTEYDWRADASAAGTGILYIAMAGTLWLPVMYVTAELGYPSSYVIGPFVVVVLVAGFVGRFKGKRDAQARLTNKEST